MIQNSIKMRSNYGFECTKIMPLSRRSKRIYESPNLESRHRRYDTWKFPYQGKSGPRRENFQVAYLPHLDFKLGDPYIRFDRLDKGFILVHPNSWFDLILMLFWGILYLIDEIMSKISQNDLHFLHNSYTSQTYKIIGVNNELAILAFILFVLGHANFEC